MGACLTASVVTTTTIERTDASGSTAVKNLVLTLMSVGENSLLIFVMHKKKPWI
jgi:hypothetical protein